MEELDSVEGLLRAGSSRQPLAKEVLAEIPAQFLSFMQSKGFKPSGKAVTSPSAPSPLGKWGKLTLKSSI